MILGRPTNLWLGAITAILNALAVIANADGSPLASLGSLTTPEIVAVVNLALGAVIALIAVQPPTVQPDSKINVQTPSGQPNASASVGLTEAPSGETVVTATTIS
jgi:hypothetical protein